jgi:hypothetical protein
LCRLLKIWDVDGLMKQMPLKLFLEWAAFMTIENEDFDKRQLEAEVIQGVKEMRVKRGRR